MTRRVKRAVIVGAGIGGLCTAIALRKVGWDVAVYESRPDVRQSGAGLLIGANAIQALHRLGVAPQVIASSRILKALDILSPDGKLLSRTTSRPVNDDGHPENITILRSDLLAILADTLGRDAIHTKKTCTHVDATTGGVRAHFADGTEATGDVLIAADGIHSAVRRQLLPGVRPRYAGYTCWRGVIADDAALRFDREVFTETWGAGARFGVAPLANNRIYWYACLNARENDQRHADATAHSLLQYFGHFHEPVPDILERGGLEPLIWRDIVYLPPLRRFAFGRVALLGDAAHATTPNLGQGAAQAMEDAVVLAAALRDHRDVVTALQHYEKVRVPRATRVTAMSNRVGNIAQWQHPWLVRMRNWSIARTPARMTHAQFDYLHGVKLPRLDTPASHGPQEPGLDRD